MARGSLEPTYHPLFKVRVIIAIIYNLGEYYQGISLYRIYINFISRKCVVFYKKKGDF